MNNSQRLTIVALVLMVVVGVFIYASVYTLDETEQAVIVQFGAPVGEPKTQPGLYFKTPFIQEVRRFDKRLLVWDGDPNQIPTLGREFISVDTTARWRIVDPLLFMQSVQNERGAQSRLDDILDSVVRDHVSATEMVEIVRSKDWQLTEADLERAMVVDEDEEEALLQKVTRGREELMADILAVAQQQMPRLGIELVDIRIKRLNYIPSVQEQVFNRMIAERQRIAEQFSSEGRGRSAEILGEMQRDLATIRSTAARDAAIIRGKADAEATRIYNEAFSADPEFYAFFRTLESYEKTLGRSSTLIIGADSDYFKYLRDIGKPSATPGGARSNPGPGTQGANTQSPTAQ